MRLQATYCAVFAEMAAHLYRSGGSCLQHLRLLQAKYGFFDFRGGYMTAPDPSITAVVFDSIRGSVDKHAYPDTIAGVFNTGTWKMTIVRGWRAHSTCPQTIVPTTIERPVQKGHAYSNHVMFMP